MNRPGNNIVIIIPFIFLHFTLRAQQWDWSIRAGGVTPSDAASPGGISVDGAGNSYVTGSIGGTVYFGALPPLTSTAFFGNTFVAKYDASGNAVWADMQQSGMGNSDNFGEAIVSDAAGNSYVTGYFSGTAIFGSFPITATGTSGIFVVKYDPSGNVLWARSAGGPGNNEVGMGIGLDVSGNCYVTGTFTGTAVFGALLPLSSVNGSIDIFIAKYDASGNEIWAVSAGGKGVDAGRAIATNASGNCFITGDFSDTSSFGALSPLVAVSQTDVFVAGYNSSGNAIWVRRAGGLQGDQGTGICIDAFNNSYVTGWFSNSITFGALPSISVTGYSDMFIAKYNSGGNEVWAHGIGSGTPGSGHVEGDAIACDAAGNIYVTGWLDYNAYFGSLPSITAQGWNDIFIAGYDSAGNALWVESTGSPSGINIDIGWGIAADPSGDCVYGTGYFSDTISFGSLPVLTAGGYSDMYVVKFCNSQPPEALFHADDSVICVGQCINFIDSSKNNPTGWQWTFAGATPSASNAQSPVNICYYVPGFYDVELIAVNSVGSDTLLKQLYIGVNPLPVADAGNDITINNGDSSQLNAGGGVTYAWSPPGGLSCVNCPNPLAAPGATTTYTVTATDSNGCVSSDSVMVFVVNNCAQLNLPNAFSPNGDGQNDVFRVLGDCINEMTLMIFNRWGEKVFSAEGGPASGWGTLGWDGTYRGKHQETEVYVYYLSATMQDGTTVFRKGDLTLVR